MNSKSFTSLRKTSLALAILAAGTMFVTQASAAGSLVPVNPYSPAYGHPYRHGVMPTRQVHSLMQQWNKTHQRFVATGSNTLSYGGGVSGVGVLSGQSKVYLVVYGNQWGTQGTDGSGNLTFSGDSAGAAVAAQKTFKGIGTNSELWSAELTQWCDGAGVASGATSCPSSGVTHIPYQQNIYAGIYYDNSVASPASATAAQLATEANKAAAHFGNTTNASNRYAYYVIMSPPGTNPDAYQGAYCAWHDYTAQSNGNMAYSNQPYNIDSGAGCGVGFVNSPGTLDGYTMTLGHEWHEMMSDQFPAGGWTNHVVGSATNGQENSDECAWIATGSAGGAANITFSTGTFAEQASWSNDTNSCAISHAIIGGGGGSTPVANFSSTTSGLTANFTDSSTDTGGTISSRSWNFGDGATSTATNPSHTYATGNTYTVSETVTDNLSNTNTKTSSVTVSSGGGGNVLTNGVAVTGLSATTGNNLNYTMVVPSGATGLNFAMSGGTGDADMYVKFGSAPTLTSYDCRPYVTGNTESCPITTAQTGTYYVMVNSYASFTGVSLKGSYSTGGGGGGTVLSNGVAVSLPSVATGGVSSNYTLVVPAGKTTLTFNLSGGTGDADMYVKAGSAPTSATYDCRPYLTGNTETCTFSSPAAATYYVNVRAYAAYSGVSLKGTYSP